MKVSALIILSVSAFAFSAAFAQPLQPNVLYEFDAGPIWPAANLVRGGDGSFYGTSYDGGSSALGTVFRMTQNGELTTLVSFNGTNGSNPEGVLVLGNDDNFYGTTPYGGSGFNGDSHRGWGTVFKVTTNGELTTLVSFNGTNGSNPERVLVSGNDGNFYGTTPYGGSGFNDDSHSGWGTVFKVTANGELTTLVSFNGTNGANPYGTLALGNDGSFYGTTDGGGNSGLGTVFKVTPNGVLTTLVSFNGVNGARPEAPLVLGSDSILYGTTRSGSGNRGTVFKVTTNGVLTRLVSFNGVNGAHPEAPLVLGSDSILYGTTFEGGAGFGTVFKVTTNGVFTSLVSFDGTNGAAPNELVLGSDGNVYGTTPYGGSGFNGDSYSGWGTVFKVTTNGELTTLVSFNGTNGANPEGVLVLGNDGNYYGTTTYGGSSVKALFNGYGTEFQVTTNGVFQPLVSFAYAPHGDGPSGLVLGNDGNFYGTTYWGGISDHGTVFRLTTNGQLTSLISFTSTNGALPQAALVLGDDGLFYGTTIYGGLYGEGTVFKVATNGDFTSLVSFNGTNGGAPSASVLGDDGLFYGTTLWGGLYDEGTVFKVATNGDLTTLVSFNGINGSSPEAVLVLGNDGNYYGTTPYGGTSGLGTVFKVTSIGVLTSLVSFNGTNGANPTGKLTLGSDGNYYGTTSSGGSTYNRGGTGFGTVFRVTSQGVLTSLVSFNGTNGADPLGDMRLSSDGNFYGATVLGGSYTNESGNGFGTIFKVTANGVLTSLLSFDGTNGANPSSGLAIGNDGNFYGTTSAGGRSGVGVIFRLVVPRFSRVSRQPGGSLLLIGTGPAGESCRLWASTDLSLPFASWTLLTGRSFDGAGDFSYTDFDAPSNNSRFYRLSVP